MEGLTRVNPMMVRELRAQWSWLRVSHGGIVDRSATHESCSSSRSDDETSLARGYFVIPRGVVRRVAGDGVVQHAVAEDAHRVGAGSVGWRVTRVGDFRYL